ncbi:anti-sigma factor [Aquicoccus sp. SCR17]|nr:anti-sigma factor [Carideicomes alvinocaridis]
MTSAPKDIREEDLVAYVDDALTPDRRSEVEAYLNETPDAARRVEADMAIARDLRRAFAGLIAHQPLAALPAAEPRNHMPLAWAASVAMALMVGGAAGWFLRPDAAPQPTWGLVAEAFAAHRTFVVEVAHPVEVRAENKGHLATWLTNRLGRPFTVPDLRVAGLLLVGGRLLPSPTEPAAQLMYEDGNGQRLTLYLRRGSDNDPSFRFAETATEQAFYWSDTEFAYALTGALPRARLLEIAHLLQVQFEDPGAPT